jgi:hypothetical protein
MSEEKQQTGVVLLNCVSYVGLNCDLILEGDTIFLYIYSEEPHNWSNLSTKSYSQLPVAKISESEDGHKRLELIQSHNSELKIQIIFVVKVTVKQAHARVIIEIDVSEIGNDKNFRLGFTVRAEDIDISKDECES